MFKDLLFGLFNTVKKTALGYNEYGLRYSIKHLELLFPKILSLSIEEQAEYADYVCVTNLNKDWFIDGEIESKDEELDLSVIQSLNTTAIGNMAYVALNCKNEQVREKAFNQLEKVKKHYNN
jgi:hypothetical protein